ncbi:MAG TPA: hypothetical protein PLA74_06125, partial [Syntrophales bacterium]|nr:hypothetical protein [Syntrophales bacterium]
MTVPAAIEKYLKQYSVGARWRIVPGSFEGIDTVVVIPALAESDHIFRTLADLSENPPDQLTRTVVVCVVNNGDEETVSAEAFADNQYTLKILRSLVEDNGDDITKVRQSACIDRIRQSGLQVAYIDASSPGLEMPGKSAGVGFARKIGLDLSLELFDYDTDSIKLLLCLDADTLVEPAYLAAVRDSFEKEQLTAAVIAFAHQEADSADEQAAICCYELFLRYYVLGLRWAASPYAFHSIGSTMACTAEAYAAVRGMNKRRAGEDFYFLDKLAKIGRVGRITATTVHPSARPSGRVPFGT